MYTGNVILLLFNLPLVAVWIRLLMIPQVYLVPPVLLVCAIGTYSIATNLWDVVLMAAFGLLGYTMRKLDFPALPLILAFVLGRIFEEALRQSLSMSLGSFTIFLTRPIALAMLLVTVAVLVLPLVSTRERWPR
jgi:putative tricarboxylic transport membrane protein